MDKEFKKRLEEWVNNCEIYDGKSPRSRRRSSLGQILKTKEQVDRLMRDLKIASGELIIIQAPNYPN